jgi:hypothetical protein
LLTKANPAVAEDTADASPPDPADGTDGTPSDGSA